VFDKDKVGKDKSLGLVTFDTAQVVKQKDIPADWYPLEGVASGTIFNAMVLIWSDQFRISRHVLY
jgi:hypothetical protein